MIYQFRDCDLPAVIQHINFMLVTYLYQTKPILEHAIVLKGAWERDLNLLEHTTVLNQTWEGDGRLSYIFTDCQ